MRGKSHINSLNNPKIYYLFFYRTDSLRALRGWNQPKVHVSSWVFVGTICIRLFGYSRDHVCSKKQVSTVQAESLVTFDILEPIQRHDDRNALSLLALPRKR